MDDWCCHSVDRMGKELSDLVKGMKKELSTKGEDLPVSPRGLAVCSGNGPLSSTTRGM